MNIVFHCQNDFVRKDAIGQLHALYSLRLFLQNQAIYLFYPLFHMEVPNLPDIIIN